MNIPGSRKNSRFLKWDRRRKEKDISSVIFVPDTGSETVPREMRKFEQGMLYRMLEYCRDEGILVDWIDGSRGVAIGIIPSRENLGCLILVDNIGRMRMVEDPEKAGGEREQGEAFEELRYTIMEVLEMDVGTSSTFGAVLKRIIALT